MLGPTAGAPGAGGGDEIEGLAMNEATTTVSGNISTEPTSRRVGEDGTLVVSFRMISSPRRWDRASGSWTDGDRFSARVSCWRRLGENVLTSLKKGDAVFVHGRVSVHEYETNGERRQSIEIDANAVGPDLGRCAAAVVRRRDGEAADAPSGRFDVGTGTDTGTGDRWDGSVPAASPSAAGLAAGDIEDGEGRRGEQVSVLASSA